MPLACPCCRAAAVAGPLCRRCRADLTLLFALEDRREHLLAEARRLLARGRAADALTTLGDAEALRPGADVRRLRAVARLLNRDFAGAWACYSAAGN